MEVERVGAARAPYAVCLMGAPFDTPNRGVSALASSLVSLVREFNPDARVLFFMGNPSPGKRTLMLAEGPIEVEVVNHRMSPRSKPSQHIIVMLLLALTYRVAIGKRLRSAILACSANLCALAKCDVIADIHGGDSFSDIYGVARFLIGILPNMVVALLGRKTVMLPQTYGPFRTFSAKRAAGWMLRRSQCVVSRDLESEPIVRSLLGSRGASVPVSFCPDVAFTLAGRQPAETDFAIGSQASSASGTVGVNVNGLMYRGGYSGRNDFGLCLDYAALMVTLVQQMLEAHDINMLLIPHTYGAGSHDPNSDPDACRQIYDRIHGAARDRLAIITRAYDQFEVKGIIGQCDFFVGSRMHACIAAVSQCVPTAAIAYSRKFAGVFNSIGLGSCVVDARLLSEREAGDVVMTLFRGRDNHRRQMRPRVEDAKRMIRASMKRVLMDALVG